MSNDTLASDQPQNAEQMQHNQMVLSCILSGDYVTGIWAEDFFNTRPSRSTRNQALDLRLRRKAHERLRQLEQAFDVARQELSLAKTIEYPIWRVSSLRSAGYFYLRNGRPDLARDAFNEAIDTTSRWVRHENQMLRVWIAYERSKCTLASVESDLALDDPNAAIKHIEQFETEREYFSYWKSNLFQARARLAAYQQKHGLELTHGQTAHYWLDSSLEASKTVDEWSGTINVTGELLHLCNREIENVFHKAPTLNYPNKQVLYNPIRQAQALRLRAELSHNASDISKYTLEALKIEDELFLDWPYYRAELWFLA